MLERRLSGKQINLKILTNMHMQEARIFHGKYDYDMKILTKQKKSYEKG